jgi:hypothetical protein
MTVARFECCHLGSCHMARRVQEGILKGILMLLQDMSRVLAVDILVEGTQDPEGSSVVGRKYLGDGLPPRD